YGTPATAKNQRTRTSYECGSLGHYKSEYPIVKFHKRMDMIHGRMRASKPKTMQDAIEIVGNKIHKAFPLPGESSHWQYKFLLPVEGVLTARRMKIPLPGVCTAMMKKLPVKDKWQLH
nr:hypothetical protein [Tanacetum cinerariifolium]